MKMKIELDSGTVIEGSDAEEISRILIALNRKNETEEEKKPGYVRAYVRSRVHNNPVPCVPITDKNTIRQMKEMAAEGISYKKIAERFASTEWMVRRALGKLNKRKKIAPDRSIKKSNNLTQDVKDCIIEQHTNGRTCIQIAESLKLKYSAVYTVCRRAGLGKHKVNVPSESMVRQQLTMISAIRSSLSEEDILCKDVRDLLSVVLEKHPEFKYKSRKMLLRIKEYQRRFMHANNQSVMLKEEADSVPVPESTEETGDGFSILGIKLA